MGQGGRERTEKGEEGRSPVRESSTCRPGETMVMCISW